MTPELMSQIDVVVSAEHRMNLVELEHMALDQLEGYPGFKRQHRYLSRWRNESAICLINFVIDNYKHRPTINMTFNSPPAPANYEAGIQMIIAEYETLRLQYVSLARLSLASNNDELMQFAENKLCWIAKTKMKYHRDLEESRGKSADYIQLRSERMHEKYRLKEQKFSINY
ncbi:MAG: hypothetical protein RLZZ44_926 [Bacteroidota bacterium]|jgi:hypothetical protein